MRKQILSFGAIHLLINSFLSIKTLRIAMIACLLLESWSHLIFSNNAPAILHYQTNDRNYFCETRFNSFNQSQADTFSINIEILENPTCPQDSNGQIKIRVVGMYPPYSYSWSSGDTTNYITHRKTGNYTVIVTDAAQISLSKTFELRSGDTIAPKLIAKDSKVYLDLAGQAVPKMSDFIITNSDNCDTLPILTINIDTFRCNHLGKENYIISSTDVTGNKTNDTIEIEVLDTIKPSIVCSANVTINCQANTSPANTGTSNAFDNCTSVISNIGYTDLKIQGSCNDNYNITRTWTVFDSNGNSNSCIQIITVVDTARPRVYCPENLTINCHVDTSPARTGTSVSVDNCTNRVTTKSYSDRINYITCNDNYIIYRIWTEHDSCGNSNSCDQIITVQDTTKPAITCPTNVTIQCEASYFPANTGSATATDNCTNVVTNIIYTDSRTNGSCHDNYNITRTWSAIDSCGNLKSCIQKIIVIDTARPKVFCPENLTVSCQEEILPARTGKASAIDNCTNVVTNFSYSDEINYGSLSNNFSITRTWNAVDSCGNQNNCIQIITALDTIKLDSVKTTNSSNANDGKIELFITDADSIGWYNAITFSYVNNSGLNLSPGDYIAKVHKDNCIFVYGPYKIQLFNSNFNLEELNLKAYPIPFTDEIHVVTDSKSELNYSLSNVQGNIICRGVFENTTTLDVSYLNSGIYLLKCFGTKRSSTIRLIKI